jgi:hypothetical protein
LFFPQTLQFGTALSALALLSTLLLAALLLALLALLPLLLALTLTLLLTLPLTLLLALLLAALARLTLLLITLLAALALLLSLLLQLFHAVFERLLPFSQRNRFIGGLLERFFHRASRLIRHRVARRLELVGRFLEAFRGLLTRAGSLFALPGGGLVRRALHLLLRLAQFLARL